MSPASSPQSSFQYLNVAQSLENVGDVSALAEMLLMLQEVLARDLPLIGQHMDEQDFPAAQQLLHSLKGCIPIFCTTALCEELLLVEQLSKSSAPQASAPAYGLLRVKLDALRSEIAIQVGAY